MPELSGIVESVSDNELVFDFEADVLDADVNLAPAGLAQQTRRPKRLGLAGAQDVLQIVQGEARIDDVFDDNDVAGLKRRVEVLEQAHFARALRRGAVAGHRDEIERHGAGRHRSREVGEKHERPLQHGDEVQRLSSWIIGVDLGGELDDAFLYAFGGKQGRHGGAKDSMKQFEIITEADARLLDVGETVALRKGGHVTPLAADTLKSRRVTVVTDTVLDRAEEGLAPVADIRRLAIGSDHSGLSLKSAIVAALRSKGMAVDDLGTLTADPVDYPDTAARVAKAVARGEADAGIVIDGAGLGSAIAANKIRGVRAAMCSTPTLARYAREHNGANVLALGSSLLAVAEAKEIVDLWLETPIREPRYLRRLLKIRRLEDAF